MFFETQYYFKKLAEYFHNTSKIQESVGKKIHSNAQKRYTEASLPTVHISKKKQNPKIALKICQNFPNSKLKKPKYIKNA